MALLPNSSVRTMSHHRASFEFVEVVKSTLQLPERRRHWSLRPWAEKVAADGWVLLTDLSDAMESQDPRMYSLDRYIELACEIFELPLRFSMSKPRNRHSDEVLHKGVGVVDAASLMVQFEKLGFNVNPSALVELLQPKLAAQNRFSLAEFEVMFHGRNVDRGEIVLATQPSPIFGDSKKFVSDSGYRIDWLSRDSHASLKVRGPKFRKAKPRIELTCDYCAHTYTKGDLDSAIAHRREHQRHKNAMDPSPLPAFALRLNETSEGDVINRSAPKWGHKEMYERAVMFKREMSYDFIQWGYPPKRGVTQEDGTGYLLADATEPSTFVGACAFRLREGIWTMDWAWLAPKYRRKGTLQRYWSRFVDAHGDFALEYPLSDAMREFVLQHGTAVQQKRVRDDCGLNPA